MSKITDFFVCVVSMVLIVGVAFLVYLGVPQTLRNVRLVPTAGTGQELIIPKLDYNRLFKTIEYNDGGKRVILNVTNYKMILEED